MISNATPKRPGRSIPLHWLNDDPFRSHFFNALSYGIPKGEAYVISSISQALPLLPDTSDLEMLRADAARLADEECAHQTAHYMLNDALKQSGFVNPWPGESVVAWFQRFTVNTNLAFTAAVEFLGAIFAHFLLVTPNLMDHAEPRLRRSWQWHALEEIDHRSVAFDLYQAMGGGWLKRAGALLGAVIFVGFLALRLCVYNLHQEKNLYKLSTLRSVLSFFCGRHGLVWHMLPRVLHYLSPLHHPSQVCNDRLEPYRAPHAAEGKTSESTVTSG